MKKYLVMGVALLALSGCSSFNEYCTGAAAGGAAVGGLNPLGWPCAGYQAARIGKGIGTLVSGSDSTPTREKTFVSSKTIQEDIANRAEIMSFVLRCIDHYKAQEYGSASDEQKKNLTGRYVSTVCARPVLISDKGDRWQIAYEGE